MSKLVVFSIEARVGAANAKGFIYPFGIL